MRRLLTEETIELHELIETVWRGKWIIAGLTSLLMLVAGILSWFVMLEKFESKATVQIAGEVHDTRIMSSYVAAEFKPIIFTQRIQIKSLMNEAFDEAGIEKINTKNLSAIAQASDGLSDLTKR